MRFATTSANKLIPVQGCLNAELILSRQTPHNAICTRWLHGPQQVNPATKPATTLFLHSYTRTLQLAVRFTLQVAMESTTTELTFAHQKQET